MGNVPDKDAGIVSRYYIEKDDIIGHINRDRSIYDLLEVIMIRINDHMKSDDATLNLLQTIFSGVISQEEKLEKLKVAGIVMDSDMTGGVSEMCNYSEYILEKGRVLEYISIRREDGWDEAKIEKGIIEKFHISEEYAKKWMKEASLLPVTK